MISFLFIQFLKVDPIEGQIKFGNQPADAGIKSLRRGPVDTPKVDGFLKAAPTLKPSW